ncbi:hypothetical protein [Jeotgalicoccus sp. WY2]|uniref:hypothetical protein n=1 Tax=Jeotgalicoccus sp. WY2 TaxID=2708346 RepID=UPI0035302831
MSPILFKYSKKLVSDVKRINCNCSNLKNNKLRQNTVKLIRSLKMIGKGLEKRADIYHSNDLNTLAQGVICTIIHDSKLVYDSHEVQTDRTGYNPDTKISRKKFD